MRRRVFGNLYGQSFFRPRLAPAIRTGDDRPPRETLDLHIISFEARQFVRSGARLWTQRGFHVVA